MNRSQETDTSSSIRTVSRRGFVSALLACIPGIPLFRALRPKPLIVQYRANALGILANLEAIDASLMRSPAESSSLFALCRRVNAERHQREFINAFFWSPANSAGAPKSSFLECSRRWDS